MRLCAFLALASTHWFASMGVTGGGTTVSPMAYKLDVLWSAPTFDALVAAPRAEAMSSFEAIGSWFIWLWTMIVAATVVAFALSFFVSAKTVIYFLLRRRVDATDLDEVYIEEPTEEFESEPVAEPAPAETEKPADAGEPKTEGE